MALGGFCRCFGGFRHGGVGDAGGRGVSVHIPQQHRIGGDHRDLMGAGTPDFVSVVVMVYDTAAIGDDGVAKTLRSQIAAERFMRLLADGFNRQ